MTLAPHPIRPTGAFPLERKQQIVQAVLSAPPGMSNHVLGRAVGVNRESVRRIRLGMLWADVLPALPRYSPERFTVRCTGCALWDGACGLGIPEAAENPRYARECSAFMEAP